MVLLSQMKDKPHQSGLSESFEVDGLVVKVSGQLWRNWQAPQVQAFCGIWGKLENFFI